jgi:hypothetical protein
MGDREWLWQALELHQGWEGKSMKEFFLKMMDSKDPSVSSGVFLSVITVLTILYVWGVVSIWMRAIQEIPTGVWTFAGVVVLGKVGSIFADRPAANTTTTTATETKTSSVTGADK